MAWDGFRRIGFRKKKEMPSGLWIRCPGCENSQYKRLVEERLQVCPECNFHFEISGRDRIAVLLDEGSFEEHHAELAPTDPLKFNARRSYKERLDEAQALTGLKDATIIGTGKIGGKDVVFGVSDSRFLRGSMGSVVGEKITRGIETAIRTGHPLIFVSGSGGGARMDEGVLSLMQMSKTSAALARLHEAGGLFISILTNPTMGGAMASFATLGDIVMAEPNALLGFAGPNVIRQTLKAEIPEGFQRSEFLLDHGFLDLIVSRSEMRKTLILLLEYLTPRERRVQSRRS